MARNFSWVTTAPGGAGRRRGGGTANALRRETIAAWLVGAGVWLAGLAFLALQTAPGAHAGTPPDAPYYQLSSSNTYLQDVAGRYTVVVRALRPAHCE